MSWRKIKTMNCMYNILIIRMESADLILNEERETEEETKEDISYLGLDIFDPPIDAMFDIWVNRVTKMQATLTSKAIIGLLFQKYNIFTILSHLKSVFLCERGDLMNDFVESIYTPEGKIDKYGIMNANSLFENFESIKCPEVKFKLQIQSNAIIDEVGCLDKGVV